MAEPFLGELRLMSFNFAPKGWAECNGQLLPINQNQPLFSLFGTMYGGDGRVNFGLPDLRGRVPIHLSSSYNQGEKLGQEFHTLTTSEMPAHNHMIQASSQEGNQAAPVILAGSENTYRSADQLTTIHPATLQKTGGSQPHENRPPFTVLNWCVALQGIFPSRN
ncbi:MAG TPA: tail fiber protein [Solirubrobacterales bacterium]|nr:tail fiber protein [Solirubrobacterales bacterium]